MGNTKSRETVDFWHPENRQVSTYSHPFEWSNYIKFTANVQIDLGLLFFPTTHLYNFARIMGLAGGTYQKHTQHF